MSEDDGTPSSRASKRQATRLFGTPAAAPPERAGATIRVEPTEAPASARPAAVPPPPTSQPSQPGSQSAQRTVRIDPTAPTASPASPHARPSIASPQRPSRPSRSRTTILELSEVAQRMSVLRATSGGEPSFTQQLALSFAVSATLVLLGTMVLAGGAWRIVLGMLAGITGSTALVWVALRSLPKIAKRLGTRELPGTPTMWLAALFGVALTATAGLTWGVSEATKPLARFGGADFELPASASAAEVPTETAKTAGGRADAAMKRGQHVNLGDGVLYAPPQFTSADGQFDLLIHYHGNTELIERSIDASKLDAIAYIVNFGEMSGRYSEPLRNPHAFDESLERIEKRVGEKLGLERPRIRRVALSSWSAGFGAVYHVLTSRSRLDRIDALLMMDSLHASYAPGSQSKVTDLSVQPFVRFAERAIAGEKLFVLTHSSVETIDYPSTTKSADALLERVGVAREVVDPEKASPPPVDIEVALKAFPSKDREWVKVKSLASKGSFTVVGGKGNDKGDHIAHLAQMSVLTLPKLVERWKTPE